MPLPPALPAAWHQGPAALHRAPSSTSSLFPANERPPSSASSGTLQPAKPTLGPHRVSMEFFLLPKSLAWLPGQEAFRKSRLQGALRNQMRVLGSSSPPWHLPKAPSCGGTTTGPGTLIFNNQRRWLDTGTQRPGGEQSCCGHGSASCGCVACVLRCLVSNGSAAK